MDYIKIGKSDLKVSVIGLGTWQFGSKGWGYGSEYGKKEAIKIINKALELGINFIDTAEVYGDGLSEEIIGEAIKGWNRDELIIATKVAPWNLTYKRVLKAAERSLRRLRTNYIDLYQIHWPNPIIPLSSTMKAMKELIKAGKVRYVGVSNFSLTRLKKARSFLPEIDIISNQVKYNMIERSIEKDLLPYCKREDLVIIAYSRSG